MGAYFSAKAQKGGFSYGGKMIENIEDLRHHLATSVWFEAGYLEYRVKNPLSGESKIGGIEMCMEVSPSGNQTDMAFELNEKTIFMLPLNECKRIVVVVNETGSYLAENDSEQHQNGFRKISGISTGDISLNKELVIRIRADKGLKIGDRNGESDNKCGGCGKMTLKIEYTGEKIYQPKISEILDSPREFENKKVVLAVHPAGWVCHGKSTPIPAGFSRSATMVYDDTGCLYGDGDILVGRILSPEIHRMNEPGNETIVVEGKIMLDKTGIPYISS